MPHDWDVFCAHAKVDKPRVLPLVAALRQAGLRVFLDEDSIPLGEEWDYFIPLAQRASVATVLCLSASYAHAFYERAEAHDAIRLKRRGGHLVVPLYLDGAPGPDDILYGVNLLQGVILPQVGVDEAVRRIVGAVRGATKAAAMGPLAPEAVPPTALEAALRRLTRGTFGELVHALGWGSYVLPDTVEPIRRVVQLIELAGELPGGTDKLVATLRALRPGIV